MLTKFLWHGKTVNLTGDNINISSNNFNVDKNGNMTCNNASMNNANITGGQIKLKDTSSTGSRKILIENESNSNIKTTIGTSGFNFSGERYNCYFIPNAGDSVQFFLGNGDTQPRWDSAISMNVYDSNIENTNISLMNNRDGINSSTTIKPSGITTPKVTQTSMETDKKNFEKISDNAIEIIKATDIYKYNLKSEKDTEKKHIGFVIGDKYNYSKEITAVDENGNEIGVDNYAMTSVCFKAIQEQQEIIEQLQEEIKKLKEEK